MDTEEQPQPARDNDQSLSLIEELLGRLSFSEALPTNEKHCLSQETPPNESGSPEIPPDEAECVTPRPTTFVSRHPDHESGSPEIVPDESGFTPEPTLFLSRRFREPDRDSPEAGPPFKAECESPTHEEIDPDIMDRSVQMSHACDQTPLAEEGKTSITRRVLHGDVRQEACT